MHANTGDVVIRDCVSGFVIVDAVSQQQLGGPFRSIADAALAARRTTPDGHVWREHLDARGQSLGPPFLLELLPSSLAS